MTARSCGERGVGEGFLLANKATVVLVIPIALRASIELGASPYPFAMTVAIAASAAFATPFSTTVVTLVVEPGSDRFVDFARAGISLPVLTCATAMFAAPIAFPF